MVRQVLDLDTFGSIQKKNVAALGAKSAGRATEPAICRTLIRLVSCRKRT